MYVYLMGLLSQQAFLFAFIADTVATTQGDGTVPASSMHLEDNNQVKAVTVIDNIEHRASYGRELSRLATLYGICRIVDTHGSTV